MNQSTYERLFNKMKDYSNSEFPITDFLNDIINNTDKNFNKEGAYKDIEKIFDTFMLYHNEVEKYRKIEEQIGCPLDVAHSVQPGKVVCVFFPNKRMYRCIVDRVSYFGFTLSGEPDFPDFIYFNQYKRIWWLKADRSE